MFKAILLDLQYMPAISSLHRLGSPRNVDFIRAESGEDVSKICWGRRPSKNHLCVHWLFVKGVWYPIR